MKFLVIFLLLIFGFTVYAQQHVAGKWQGDLEVQSMKLPLVFTISDTAGNLNASILSPKQSETAMKADSVSFENNQLQIFMKVLNAGYSAVYEGDSLKGFFTQNGMQLSLNLKRSNGNERTVNRPQTPRPPFYYHIEEVSFRNEKEGNELAGTITTPKDRKNFPIVVMITGSGAQDRDETLFEHKPFWVIADYFAKNGIGALRLDDRGVGGSTAGKKDATSADFSTDIEAAVNFLKKRGYNNIGLLGHSEGGMIAPIVATNSKDVKFIVAMAGPGIPIQQLMVLQTKEVMQSGGASKEDIDKSKKEATEIYQFMNNYAGTNFKADLEVKIKELISANEPSNKDSISAIINSQVSMLSSAWFRYFLKFDPAIYIQQLKIPVFAINGEKDVQVTPEENLAGWKTLLEKAGNKNFEVKEIPGLNHLFQDATTGSPSEYGTIEQTISPKVLELMKNWILKII